MGPESAAATPPGGTPTAHRALGSLFAALGALSGAWGVHIPSLQSTYGMDEGELAVALFAAGAGALASLFFSGRVVAWLGTRDTLRLTGWVMLASLACVLLWPHRVLLGAALVLLGMVISVHDVALNAEGTALETQGGRPVLGGLHALFSFGAMAGALLCAGLLRLGWSAPVQLAAVSAALAMVLWVSSPHLLDAHPAAPRGDGQRHFVWPRGPLLVIGCLIFAGMLAEGVMVDWSVLFLQQALSWPQERAAIGYAVFVGAMACARWQADRARARWGDERLLMSSALLATVAMTLTLAWTTPLTALIGLAAVGVGLAPVVPLLYAAAARTPGSTSAAALAAVSSIGYSGFVLGPPLMGGLAKALTLPAAMWTVAVAAGVLAIGALVLRRTLQSGPRPGPPSRSSP